MNEREQRPAYGIHIFSRGEISSTGFFSSQDITIEGESIRWETTSLPAHYRIYMQPTSKVGSGKGGMKAILIVS